MKVLVVIVVVGEVLFALAWWTSGRSKGALGRRNSIGDAQQDQAYLHANLQKQARSDMGGINPGAGL